MTCPDADENCRIDEWECPHMKPGHNRLPGCGCKCSFKCGARECKDID